MLKLKFTALICGTALLAACSISDPACFAANSGPADRVEAQAGDSQGRTKGPVAALMEKGRWLDEQGQDLQEKGAALRHQGQFVEKQALALQGAIDWLRSQLKSANEQVGVFHEKAGWLMNQITPLLQQGWRMLVSVAEVIRGQTAWFLDGAVDLFHRLGSGAG